MLDKNLLREIKNIVIEHPVFIDCLDSIMSQVEYRIKGEVPMVVGPTGAGKTTLINVASSLLTEYVVENPDLGYGPPVIIEAPSPEKGEFEWRDFYRDALRDGFKEVGIERKTNIDVAVEQLINGEYRTNYGCMSVHDHRGLFLDTSQERKPIAIFIDEVQSLSKTKGNKDKSANLDVLKSLSNKLKSPIIAVGTYEARDMLYHGGQLSRRVSLIHLCRYTKEKSNIAIYKGIVNAICGEELMVPLAKDVQKDIAYLYNHTLGCVGILIDWIIRAGALSIRRKKRVITMDEMESKRLRNIQLSAIEREIYAFENEHEEKQQYEPSFYLNKKPRKNKHQAKKKCRPGTRKPVRDLVGRNQG